MSGNDEHQIQNSNQLWEERKEIENEENEPWDSMPSLMFQKDTCSLMFTAVLFTKARTRKQPKYPSTDEWIKKMWHIYTMEYYSAIKRNEIELFVVRSMDLETAIQSEVSQKEKNQYHMLTHIYGI